MCCKCLKGRDVSFSKTCGGVLDVDFEELCGRPLWTNDYLKITQVFHTVLIRNIPILNRKKMGEARRFISLVDTLYDHRTNYTLFTVAAAAATTALEL